MSSEEGKCKGEGEGKGESEGKGQGQGEGEGGRPIACGFRQKNERISGLMTYHFHSVDRSSEPECQRVESEVCYRPCILTLTLTLTLPKRKPHPSPSLTLTHY
jgi:hypothetical protein